tara:strand:+ start:1034 stop:1738 length:705 start_codon:yes stop_codon:yes gene_type:complete
MALPKLETKTYTLTLPSTGEDIKYRPFLVKEQKILLMAQDSENSSEIVDAMSQLISDCTFGKIDTKTCPMFDAEYVFLKLRTKSVGENVQIQVTCPDDEKTKVTVSLNLEDIECTMTNDHNNMVEITDNIKMTFSYPLLSSYRTLKNKTQTEALFEMISDCVQEIQHGDEIHKKSDISSKELNEFIESLDTNQFQKIAEFFETMPKLRHVIEVENPNTKVKSEVVLQGLQSFLV